MCREVGDVRIEQIKCKVEGCITLKAISGRDDYDGDVRVRVSVRGM